MGKKHSKERRESEGRPTVMTPDILQKLEDAFVNAFTDKMACLYAGIGETTLYEYCEKNPKFAERKELLKDTPNLAAQKTLVEDVSNTGGARWWAEHKMPDFMPTSKVVVGGTLKTQDVTVDNAVKAVTEEYEKKLKDTIANNIRNKKK